ncbi:hypothetical protein WBG78_06245 [Chryseolinea sp. T2]|uniref:hypothetical protein n=1 Tax=Chryseolinea sp. T2 TaxID=3129255 RepID=UPI003076ADD8
MSSPSLAQSATPITGARGQGMGNATACLTDEWSMLNNVAGLAGTKRSSIAISYDALPALPALGKMGCTLVHPGKVALGVSLYRFGDEVYHEQIAALGAATKWSHTQVGMKLNLINYAADGMGSKSVWSVSMGAITELTSWLIVGAHITNVNQPWLSKQSDERLPTVLTAGLLFTLEQNVIVATEVEKRINDTATGRAGLEFILHKKVKSRIGFQLNPQALTGGIGFHLRHFSSDYGIVYVQALGLRHQVSLAFTPRLTRKNEQSAEDL